MSGKGSAPRPFSVSNEEYSKRWDAIFGRDLKTTPDNTGVDKAEYYDILSTEDALRSNAETKEVIEGNKK
jgi:hypothetical protein